MSCILNKPLFFLLIHIAAFKAPSANSSLEKAVCFNSIFSILLLKRTECLPIVFPFLVIKKNIISQKKGTRDGRQRELVLTEKGIKLCDEIFNKQKKKNN